MNYFLLCIMVLCYALQALTSKLYAANCEGKSDDASLRFAVIFGTFIGAATLVEGWLGAGAVTFAPSRGTVIYALCNAVFLVVYHLSQIGATARGSYAIANICMLFGGILIPMAVSMLKLGQRLNVTQTAAVVLMCIAFLLINCRTGSEKDKKAEKNKATVGFWAYCIMLALSNGAFGSALALQADYAPAEQTEMLTVSYFASAVLAAAVIALRRAAHRDSAGGKKTFRMTRRAVFFAVGCCIVATVAVNILSYLLSVMNVTVVNTVDNGGVLLLSSLFGALIFGEKPGRIRLLGLAAAFVSIVLLSC